MHRGSAKTLPMTHFTCVCNLFPIISKRILTLAMIHGINWAHWYHPLCTDAIFRVRGLELIKYVQYFYHESSFDILNPFKESSAEY